MRSMIYRDCIHLHPRKIRDSNGFEHSTCDYGDLGIAGCPPNCRFYLARPPRPSA